MTYAAEMKKKNVLVDTQENVYLIDFATVRHHHSLEDVSKLLLSILVITLEAHDEDTVSFQALCQRIVAVPSVEAAFPASSTASPRITRTEELLQVLWPHVARMNCGGEGSAMVYGLLRYGLRMVTSPQRKRRQVQQVHCTGRTPRPDRSNALCWGGEGGVSLR